MSKRANFCFFFSSRRRHTRYWRDWSSDVCSSDLRREGRELLLGGADEHVPHERHVPRAGRDVAHGEAIGRIGAAVEVLHEQLALLAQVRFYVGEQRVEESRLDRPIDGAPVDVALGLGTPDEEL